jgi:hypothetical protein
MRFLSFFLLGLLGGCTVQVNVSSQTAQALGLVMIGAAAYQYEQQRVGTPDPVPALAADRTVNEIDCSQPFDPLAGNIRCK